MNKDFAFARLEYGARLLDVLARERRSGKRDRMIGNPPRHIGKCAVVLLGHPKVDDVAVALVGELAIFVCRRLAADGLTANLCLGLHVSILRRVTGPLMRGAKRDP